MNTEGAMLYIEYLAREGYKDKRFKKIENRNKLLEVITLLQRGEINRKIIEKIKNEKYDVWISLPGSFTNMPKFVRDVEKEVIK